MSTRTRNKSVRNPTNGSVSDISEVFKKQMATGDFKGKSKQNNCNTNKNEKDKSNKDNLESNENNEEQQQAIKENAEQEQEKTHVQSNEHDKDLSKVCATPTQKELTTVSLKQAEMDEQLNVDSQNALNEQEKGRKSSEGGEAETSEDKHEDTLKQASNEEILEGLKEVCKLVKKLDNDIHHPKGGIGATLVQLTLRMDNLYSDIHGAVSGLKPTQNQLEDSVKFSSAKIETLEQNQSKIVQLMNDMKKLTQDVQLMKEMFQKHSQKLQSLEKSVLDLTRRGMEQNLVFHGIAEVKSESTDEKEDCKESVAEFLQANLQVEIDTNEIWKAHRSGQKRSGRDRVIITKVSYAAKEVIMQNVTKLKGKLNANNQKIFINEQIPEGISEIRKQVADRLKVLRTENEAKPKDQRKQIRAVNDKILIDEEVVEPEVQTLEPADLFMDSTEQRIVKALNQKIKETKPVSVKNSQFIGLAAKVHSVEEMNHLYKAVALRFPSVDHIMAAYGFKEENGKVKTGNCDDGEFGGSNIIKQTMKTAKVKDTAIFVVRKYGGVHLGFDRFATIEKMTKEALKLLRGG